MHRVSFLRHGLASIGIDKSGAQSGTRVARTHRVLRVLCLSLVLAGCVTSHGRVNVTATTAVWGGALILGGATIGAGTCQPSSDQCERIERGDPVMAGALVLAGVSLVALAVLFHQSAHD